MTILKTTPKKIPLHMRMFRFGNIYGWQFFLHWIDGRSKCFIILHRTSHSKIMSVMFRDRCHKFVSTTEAIIIISYFQKRINLRREVRHLSHKRVAINRMIRYLRCFWTEWTGYYVDVNFVFFFFFLHKTDSLTLKEIAKEVVHGLLFLFSFHSLFCNTWSRESTSLISVFALMREGPYNPLFNNFLVNIIHCQIAF